MFRFMPTRYRAALLLTIPVALFGIAGCSGGQAPPTQQEVQSFSGDPAAKAQQGQAAVEQARKKQEQEMARVRANAGPPPPPPAGAAPPVSP